MRLEFYPFPFLAGMGMLLVFLFDLRRRKRSGPYLFFFAAFWVYLLLVVGMVLFPMPIPDTSGGSYGRDPVRYILSAINLAPFNYSQYMRLGRFYIFMREIAANIVLTMPFGFGIRFITPVRSKKIVGLAFLVGVGIETAQLMANLLLGISYRGVDINDAIMNAVGLIVGYGFFRLFAWLVVVYARRRRWEPKGLVGYIYVICQGVQATTRSMAGIRSE